MAEEILRSVLGAEARARAIVAEAERAARQVEAQARSEAAALRRRLAAEAAREAQAVREGAHREAEQARSRILAAAGEDVRQLEEQARPHLDGAIRIVVQRALDP